MNKIATFLTTIISVLLLSSSISAIETEDLMWYKPEIYKNYKVVDDSNEVFKNVIPSGTYDYKVAASDSLDDPWNSAVVLYKVSSKINIKLSSSEQINEVKKIISDLYINTGGLLENLKLYNSNYILYIEETDSECLTTSFVNEIVDSLSEKDYIQMITFRESGYMSSIVEIKPFLNVESENDINRIRKIIEDNNLDVSVIKDEYPLFCKVSYNVPATAVQYIELYNLIKNEVNFASNIVDTMLPGDLVQPDLEYKYVKKVTGDINFDGKIDLLDLSELALTIIGDKTLISEQLRAADINENGKADLTDLATLKQYLSKQIDSLG